MFLVEGPFPEKLLKLWDEYDKKRKNGSDNDRPDYFPDNQLYICYEFEYGGQDMESYIFPNAASAVSAVKQVIASLAVAEDRLEFEHRDLHLGNVLIQPCQGDATFNFGTEVLPCAGVRIKIIDYSLSRMYTGGRFVFIDVSADEDLFTGEGDPQFNVYREMRKCNNNNWKRYHPQTNVMWIKFLLGKVLKGVNYKKRSGAEHRDFLEHVKEMQKVAESCSSAADLLLAATSAEGISVIGASRDQGLPLQDAFAS
ncbi:unnamed protein product, partial [Cyprideis torosa]